MVHSSQHSAAERASRPSQSASAGRATRLCPAGGRALALAPWPRGEARCCALAQTAHSCVWGAWCFGFICPLAPRIYARDRALALARGRAYLYSHTLLGVFTDHAVEMRDAKAVYTVQSDVEIVVYIACTV